MLKPLAEAMKCSGMFKPVCNEQPYSPFCTKGTRNAQNIQFTPVSGFVLVAGGRQGHLFVEQIEERTNGTS